MQALEFLANALQALARYGPQQSVNVALACVAACAIAWAGLNLMSFISRSGQAGDSDLLDRALIAYTLGALYSLLLMYIAGGLRIYTLPVLWIAVLIPGVLRGRAAIRLPRRVPNPGWRILPFIILGGGPLLVSLTNPTPSWMDVLETSVAPVQRLITFSAFDPGSALPSALYPANRSFPLFTSFYGFAAKLTGLEAYEILAASLVPMLLITLFAAYRLGTVLMPHNRHAPWLAVLSWVLTCNYLQLQSARSTVWQMTFTLIAITKAIEILRNPRSFRLLVECAVVTAASVLAHPMMGMFTALTVLVIVILALIPNRFANARQFGSAMVIGIAASAPLIPTWWPESRLAFIAAITLLMTIPFAIWFGRRTQGTTGNGEPQAWVTGAGRWIPMAAVVSTFLLQWDFYGTSRRSFITQEAMRYPLPTALTLVLIVIAVRRPSFRYGAILAGAALLAATLPLWIVPHMDLSPVMASSLRYELALKSTEYWLSAVLAVCGSLVLAWLWSREGRYRFALRVAVIALLVVSTPTVLRIPVGPAHRAAGIYGMWKWQIRLAGEGYWGGWTRRTIVGQDDRDLYRELRSYVRAGEITLEDRIAHIAPATSLLATPFPAFTGIAQDLFLPAVDKMNIHTYSGRLYDIDAGLPGHEWLLVERPMLARFNIDPAKIVYQNDRVILLHSP